MATFKVGQRVRVIGQVSSDHRPLIGKEGVIVEKWDFRWSVLLDGISNTENCDGSPEFLFAPEFLRPLTDPKAEEFLAKLETLGREPVTLTDKQLEEVRSA